MKTKGVYVNDKLVGEAMTWTAVYQLLAEKGLAFMGAHQATEGPSAFFLCGETENVDQTTVGIGVDMMIARSGASERTRAIAKGLLNTERAGALVEQDNDMLRLECLSGGYYWISIDGSRVLRGATISEADDLQAKFIDAMERAGR